MSSVLVVDDSPMLREMISGLLIKVGWTVSEAQDGFDAQTKIAAELPDLVILDVVMPKMNGYELCRWIKNNEATKDILVVLCSSKGEEFDRYWGIKQGADAYIMKPFQSEELLDTLKTLLAGKVV